MRHSTSQLLSLSIGLLLGSSEAASIPRKETCAKAKVAILGAGVAGITAAQTLHNAPLMVRLSLSSSVRIGSKAFRILRAKLTPFGIWLRSTK
ncbi:hypothetical protein LB505_013307 [Fusarium chuoi]|nr:hypothetical protein LB505_013307 [Fusarium chuoi]